MTYDVRNPGPGWGQEQNCGRVDCIIYITDENNNHQCLTPLSEACH